MPDKSNGVEQPTGADVLAAFRLNQDDLADLLRVARDVLDSPQTQRLGRDLGLAVVPLPLLDALSEAVERIGGPL